MCAKNSELKVQVTIGLCVKNNFNTIGKALTSILRQDFLFEQMELIVVDESADGTLDIVKRLLAEEKEFEAKVYHYSHLGLGPARNVVVNQASGKYIIWVDGDEILPKNHVLKQVEYMDRNPDVGAAKARYGLVESKKLVVLLENSRSFDILKSKSKLVGTSGSIYRIDAIRGIGGFDDKIKGAGEDVEALARLRKAGWLLSTSDALYYEVYKETWRRLWVQYRWWGFGAYYIKNEEKLGTSIFARLPPVAFVTGLLKIFPLFKRDPKIAYIALPLHTLFKEVAWLTGFMNACLSKNR